MIGHNKQIAIFSMKLRNTHFRNLAAQSNMSFGEKSIIMINPKVQPEMHSGQSWQYESNYLEGNKCTKFHLVNRDDFINVMFQSVYGSRHHLILPFRESRMLQYHMKLFAGKNPMTSDEKAPSGLPQTISEADLQDADFVEKN
jgi:hypothetical protein